MLQRVRVERRQLYLEVRHHLADNSFREVGSRRWTVRTKSFPEKCSSVFYSFLVRLRIVRTNLVSKERPKEGWTAQRITTIFPRVPFVKTLYAERKVKMEGHRLFLCNAFSARNVHTNRKR